MSAPPLPDAFGNYALGDFVEVVSPGTISWWPQTAGWLWLGVALALWAAYRAWGWLQHWWRNRYRREAQQQLDQLATARGGEHFVAQLNSLLKRVALTAYSRPNVASLCGEAWPDFLNAQCPAPLFSPAQSEHLASGSFRPIALPVEVCDDLINSARSWIELHCGEQRD